MTPITSVRTSAGWGLSLSYSLIQWLLLPRLPQVRKELPGLNLRILDRPTNEVAIRPRDGTVDMGLVRDGSVAPSLKGIELGLMTYSLFAPSADVDCIGKRNSCLRKTVSASTKLSSEFVDSPAPYPYVQAACSTWSHLTRPPAISRKRLRS